MKKNELTHTSVELSWFESYSGGSTITMNRVTEIFRSRFFVSRKLFLEKKLFFEKNRLRDFNSRYYYFSLPWNLR